MATNGKAKGIHDVMTGKHLADRWHVLDAIGGGGMGDVYRGFDLKLKVPVAIKVLSPNLRGDPSIVKRFADEVDTLKRSAHPNIAIIHDFSKDEDIIYIVMEFLDGPTLNAVLDESPDRRLHLQRVRRIFTQILDALAVVHGRGIIHRDLKPENVFVLWLGSGRRNTDVVKLIDFGIAKFRGGPQAARPGLTLAGEVLGTPFYMSPEQCRGETNVDNRTDLYAVGVMLYEAVTGQLPFNKPTHAEIMTAHLNEFPNAPRMINPEISDELEAVIFRALSKKPDNRFQDAVEFSEALEATIAEDMAFYRDSQRVSLVNGMAFSTPPRLPTTVDDDQPTAERLEPIDVSRTPTRQLADRRPPAGLALALTVTPSGLKREMLKVKMAAMVRKIAKSVWAWMAAMAWRIAKRLDPWLSKKRPPYARYLHASLILAIAFILSLVIIPSIGGGDASASDGDIGETQAADADDASDVLIVHVPVFLPTPTNRDAGTNEPEDAGTKVAADVGVDANDAREEPEAEVATEVSETVDEYMGLVTATQRDTNLQRAITNLEKLTQDWPERYEAWEALGDALRLQRGQTERARTAYTRCLELIPPNALSKRAKVEGKIRGLK